MEPPVDPTRHTISAAHSGHSILQWLRSALPGWSWSQCRQVLAARRVTVNGVLVTHEGRRLSTGDEVELTERSAPKPNPKHLSLVYLDRDIVVVEKPPGIVSTRRPEEQHWSLEKRLLDPTLDELTALAIRDREFSPAQSRREPKWRSLPPLYRAQRLDRGTSGLLVFARTNFAAEGLIRQFATHTVQRRYAAVVHGTPAVGVISTRLVRDRGDGLRGSTRSETGGQPAITHITAVRPLGPYSEITCQLETGRTHQIRIHLAELGHPVCGEDRYNQLLGRGLRIDTSGVPRIALHACALGLSHPVSGEPLEFQSEWPDDISAWLASMSAQSPAS